MFQSNNGSALILEDLTLSLTSRTAVLYPVRNLNLTVKPGSLHAIIGESGSGKSLTCRAIMRLGPHELRIASGSIRVCGTDISTLHGRELSGFRGRQVAMVFQDPAPHFNPGKRVGDHLIRTLEKRLGLGSEEARTRFTELLSRVGLSGRDELLRKYPHELSGGMAQRLAIAAAIAASPPLLIADEPTTALDVTVQKSVLELIDELRRTLGLAVLFVSHDLALVEKYADEITVLYAGTVVEQNRSLGLFRSPRHPYTQALLRARPGPGQPVPPAIAGTAPRLDRIPPGCPFHVRCPAAEPICRTVLPDHTRWDDGGSAACHVAARTTARRV
ncbi:MAG: ABC transporter ATP-binding protein [Spirochaetaceae bacterium]